LNIETDNQEERMLHSSIYDMVSGPDFCLFITEEGNMYAMGQNDHGMLGLGKEYRNTANLAKQVRFIRFSKYPYR
jgi:alpha-tubulin suppressor-like RCC1 family protein